MKVLLVGQNPKVLANLTNPFQDTPSGRRLDKWLDYLHSKIPGLRFDIVNATDRFDVKPALYYQEDIEAIEDYARDFDRVIALGNYAAGLLKRAKIKHFKLPHPSGLNRRLNARGYEKGQLDSCIAYLINF